jgi:Bacteriophage probable baseplate hub protein
MARSPIPIQAQTETFYVPAFRVSVQGRGLPDDVVRDVTQVSYRDSASEIDSFELVVNNWDAQARDFKYEPGSGSLQGIFDPGQEIRLEMGYARDVRLMLVGEITALEPDYPAAGAPTLRVRGLNILHRLRKRQHTWAWERVRDSDLARALGARTGGGEEPGLGITVRTSGTAAADEPEEPYLFMDNQYDIVFLLGRARRRGYTVRLEVDGDTADRYVYFGPSRDLRDVTYRLEWGRSLIDFRPTLSTARQVRKVTVRAWNRRTKKPIERSATWGQGGIDANRDLRGVDEAIRDREEVVVDEPMHTPELARARARDILNRQLEEMVKASGTTVGLPDLRAGRRLQITGLGARFSGEYFVTQTTHTINDNGYRTGFSARRERRAA